MYSQQEAKNTHEGSKTPTEKIKNLKHHKWYVQQKEVVARITTKQYTTQKQLPTVSEGGPLVA